MAILSADGGSRKTAINKNQWQMFKKVDKVLVIALLLGLAFGLYGINWGWVECWNPDQMALRNLFHEGELPFNPKWFEKPPIHTYFNYFLAIWPLQNLDNIFHFPLEFFLTAKLLWSRSVTVCLFLGAIILVFYITKRFFGVFAARIIALVFSTSAGFILDSHYLTADMPVLFWMLVAFYFTQSISLFGKGSDYAWAGFFTGIATATKYNGLSVGITIVVAHILSFNAID